MTQDYERLKEYCDETMGIVRKFIKGEALPDDRSFERNYIGELLYQYQQKNIIPQLDVDDTMPPLKVTQECTGDYKIMALFDAEEPLSFAEFHYDQKNFVSILHAPWTKFEPTEIAEKKHKIAVEIARRAMLYPVLMKEALDKDRRMVGYEATIDDMRDEISRLQHRLNPDND